MKKNSKPSSSAKKSTRKGKTKSVNQKPKKAKVSKPKLRRKPSQAARKPVGNPIHVGPVPVGKHPSDVKHEHEWIFHREHQVVSGGSDSTRIHGRQFLDSISIPAGETSIPVGTILYVGELGPQFLGGRPELQARVWSLWGPRTERDGTTKDPFEVELRPVVSSVTSGAYACFYVFGDTADEYRKLGTSAERFRKASATAGFRQKHIYDPTDMKVHWPKGQGDKFLRGEDETDPAWLRAGVFVVMAASTLQRPFDAVDSETVLLNVYCAYDLQMNTPYLADRARGGLATVRGAAPIVTVVGSPVYGLMPQEASLDIPASIESTGVVTRAITPTKYSTASCVTMTYEAAKRYFVSDLKGRDIDWQAVHGVTDGVHKDFSARRRVGTILGYREGYGDFTGTLASSLIGLLPFGATIKSIVNGIGGLFQGVQNNSDKNLIVKSKNKVTSGHAYDSTLFPPVDPERFYGTGSVTSPTPFGAVGQAAQRLNNWGPVAEEPGPFSADLGVVYGSTGVTKAPIKDQPESPTGVWNGSYIAAPALPFAPSTYGGSRTQNLQTRTSTDPTTAFTALGWSRTNPQSILSVPPGGAFGYSPYVRPSATTSDPDVLYKLNYGSGGVGFNGTAIDGPDSGLAKTDITLSSSSSGLETPIPSLSSSRVIADDSADRVRVVTDELARNWYNFQHISDHPHRSEMTPHLVRKWFVTRQRIRDLRKLSSPTLEQARFLFRFHVDDRLILNRLPKRRFTTLKIEKAVTFGPILARPDDKDPPVSVEKEYPISKVRDPSSALHKAAMLQKRSG